MFPMSYLSEYIQVGMVLFLGLDLFWLLMTSSLLFDLSISFNVMPATVGSVTLGCYSIFMAFSLR